MAYTADEKRQLAKAPKGTKLGNAPLTEKEWAKRAERDVLAAYASDFMGNKPNATWAEIRKDRAERAKRDKAELDAYNNLKKNPRKR
jgi:hypothetical protein